MANHARVDGQKKKKKAKNCWDMMQSRIGIRRMRVAPDLEMGHGKKKQMESEEKKRKEYEQIN